MTRSFFLGTALCLLLAASGCSRSPRVTFYTLEPGVQSQAPVPGQAVPQPPGPLAQPQAQGAPSVLVGPVTLPELVDRPQLVMRSAQNRVQILESHRWAEPLKSEIPRLVAQNLGRLLGSDRVSSYRQQTGAGAEYRVLLDIVRLESDPGDSVTLETAWSVRRTPGGAARAGRLVVREKVQGQGYHAVVAALSRALAGVSADIAKALQAEGAARLP